MIIRARASASGTTCQLNIETGLAWARVNLDSRPMYDVPAEEWGDYCAAMLQVPVLPPALPAEQWATAVARREGSGYLRQGERQQLLISAVHLAALLPATSLFEDEPFDAVAAGELYHGRHFHGPRNIFLYVPSTTVQIRLLNDPGMSREMCAVGYLFDLETEDEHGNVARFFYRPYNTGFATSARWPRPLQDLREEIERLRNP